MSWLPRERLLLGSIATLAAALAYFQAANFPFVPFTDAICFLPQAVKFAQGDGLRNVYLFPYVPDGAYIWHGFLLPLLLGGLFKTDTYIKVSEALGFLNALNVLLLALALIRIASQWQLLRRALFLALCLLAQTGFVMGSLGRPETLSSLLISAGLLLWTLKPSAVVYSAIGAITGLLAVTSPFPAAMAALCLLLALIVREQRIYALSKICGLVAIFAVIAVMISFALYPYSFSLWVWGIKQHSELLSIRSHLSLDTVDLLRQFFDSTGRFMMGPVFATSVAAAVLLVCEKRSLSVGLRVILGVCIILFSALVVRGSLVSGFYVMLPLFPIGAGVVAALFSLRYTAMHRRLTLLKACAILSISMAALDPILLQAGRVSGFSSMSFQDARQHFARDISRMPGTVALSMDLAVLSDSTDRLQPIFYFVPPIEEPDTDWLVVQQSTYFYDKPPSYTNFTLVQNRFVDRFVDVHKLPGRLFQWFGVNGYGYAVYKKSHHAR